MNAASSPLTPEPKDEGAAGSPPAPPAPLFGFGFPWEAQLAFRHVFLLFFTQPGDREVLERLGTLLYSMAKECLDKWPDWPESPTRTELRAVALDLHFAASYLASIDNARNFSSSLSDEDERLSHMAGTWGARVYQIAREIESSGVSS